MEVISKVERTAVRRSLHRLVRGFGVKTGLCGRKPKHSFPEQEPNSKQARARKRASTNGRRPSDAARSGQREALQRHSLQRLRKKARETPQWAGCGWEKTG